MIYKSFKDAELFEGATNKTYEYNIEDKDINFCIAEISGRFPKEKWAVNRKCKEMIFVLSGEGLINVGGREYSLKQEDVVLINPNEKYFLLGEMRLGIPCAPAWCPEQHEEVEFEK